MSSAFRRGGSFVAFAWSGKAADPRDQEFAAALATRRFRTIDGAASEEISAGWVTPADPTGDSFDLEDLDGGPATWLRVRVDKKSLPKAVLAHHLAVAEKARGRRLSGRERRELKDGLMESVLPRVIPSTANLDALLFHDRRLLLLFAGSKAGRETFGKLFFETFGVPLVRMTSGTQAITVHGLDEVHKLQPTRWPGGGLRQLCIESDADFLGEEFLTWLWFRWETEGGEFTLPGGRVVGIAIDDLLQFAARSADEHTQTLRHGLPTKAPEARVALKSGHRLSHARLLIAEGSRQWGVAMHGAELRFGSTKLPDDAEECESDIDRTGDRAANWLGLHEIVGALYGVFLRVRIGSGWIPEAARMERWMAQ